MRRADTAGVGGEGYRSVKRRNNQCAKHPPCSAETLLRMMDLSDSGNGRDTIGRLLGISPNTLRHWIKAYKSGLLRRGDGGIHWGERFITFAPMQPTTLENQRLKMEIAALKAAPRVTCDSPSNPTPEELWNRAKADNRLRCEQAQKEGRFAVSFADGPIAICFASDQHLAVGEPTDMDQMQADAELIAATPNLYVILGGDGVQNHIKHRAAMLNSRSTARDQYLLYDHYLTILNRSILAVIDGNHDKWSLQFAGIDMVQILCRDNKLCYARDEAHIDLVVGDVKYTASVRHQYRYGSSFNQTHTVKRWWEMGPVNWDIGVVCHHHEASVEPFTKHGVERWAARPGSYQITSAYSRQYGFNNTKPTCPTFILHDRARKIEGFASLETGVKVLNALR